MKSHRAIKNFSRFLWFASTLSVGTAVAQVQVFHASWEQSSWEVESGPQQCTLVHEVPGFGRARFEQRSGRRLQLSIVADQPAVRDQLARVHAETPPWRHKVARRVLGEFPLQRGKTPLVIPGDQALRVYYELEQGMQTVVEFADRGDGGGQVRVALMPVRFSATAAEFQQCIGKLIYLDFEPIDEETVFFATDSDRLSLAARRTLEVIALNYRRQAGVRLVLGGHADARGDSGYNFDLSRRRATAVARYLRSRGVSGALIETRVFGETLPADTQNGKDAWAKNRRVTVWLAEKSAGG